MRLIIGAAAVLWTVQLAWAQAPQPQFEVTSVRPLADSSRYSPAGCTNGRFTARDTLDFVIRWAFDLRDYQYSQLDSKLPDWVSGDDFDIEATTGQPSVTEAECRLMLRSLLADRFKLAFHWDTKQGKVYDLVVAPGGHKLKRVDEGDTGLGFHFIFNGLPFGGAAGMAPITMQQLTSWVSQDGPVADKTGLEGRYRFDLSYSTLPPDRTTDPNLDTALKQQLGLLLQEHKGSVSYFVVDHIEKPDPN